MCDKIIYRKNYFSLKRDFAGEKNRNPLITNQKKFPKILINDYLIHFLKEDNILEFFMRAIFWGEWFFRDTRNSKIYKPII